MSLRTKIQDAMEDKGILLHTLVKDLNFSKNAVYKFTLKGIQYDNLKRIAFYLDKPLDYFDPDLRRSPSPLTNRTAAQQIAHLKSMLAEKERLIKRQEELIESQKAQLISKKYDK